MMKLVTSLFLFSLLGVASAVKERAMWIDYSMCTLDAAQTLAVQDAITSFYDTYDINGNEFLERRFLRDVVHRGTQSCEWYHEHYCCNGACSYCQAFQCDANVCGLGVPCRRRAEDMDGPAQRKLGDVWEKKCKIKDDELHILLEAETDSTDSTVLNCLNAVDCKILRKD